MCLTWETGELANSETGRGGGFGAASRSRTLLQTVLRDINDKEAPESLPEGE